MAISFKYIVCNIHKYCVISEMCDDISVLLRDHSEIIAVGGGGVGLGVDGWW